MKDKRWAKNRQPTSIKIITYTETCRQECFTRGRSALCALINIPSGEDKPTTDVETVSPSLSVRGENEREREQEGKKRKW